MTYEKKVLDHGYVKLRNIAGPTRRMGRTTTIEDAGDGLPLTSVGPRAFDADDTDPANAARLSFEGMDADRTYEAEMKLNRYLLKNLHMTPFETVIVWLEVKAPIFVSRQLVRQRTQTIDEASARYITLPAEWYVPEVVGGKAVDKKQGQSDNLSPEVQAAFKGELEHLCQTSYASYQDAIANGVAPEHARMMLHLNHYTHWMTTQNLRNLMFSFLALRDHEHAQIETQMYARATVELLEPHLPGLMGLYKEMIRK